MRRERCPAGRVGRDPSRQQEGTGGVSRLDVLIGGCADLPGSSLPPQNALPAPGRFLGRARVGVARHGKLSKGLGLVARWKKTKF